jgi:5-methylcytosine-specific restriction protein A
MQLLQGNRAIRDNVEDGKDLLLFESTQQSGMYRFLGCYACGGWTYRIAPDRDGTNRNATVFQLVPVSAELLDPEPDAVVSSATLEELRRAAYAAAATQAQTTQRRQTQFLRTQCSCEGLRPKAGEWVL